MGYDIYLIYKKGDSEVVAEVDTHREGSTYRVDGTTKASLKVTWNYSGFFRQSLDKELGIRWLFGRQAKDCINTLEKAIVELGTKPSSDYWESTPGNAGYALFILFGWAKQHPQAIFQGE